MMRRQRHPQSQNPGEKLRSALKPRRKSMRFSRKAMFLLWTAKRTELYTCVPFLLFVHGRDLEPDLAVATAGVALIP
jgi:hypothetical protein